MNKNSDLSPLLQVFEFMGPILAGFQVSTYALGFLGTGAFANWVIMHWFPFTHHVWNVVLNYIDFSEITDIEKDSLTTLIFFIPLGAWSIYKYFFLKKDFQTFKTKVLALSVGTLFIFILGGQILTDMVEYLTSFNNFTDADDLFATFFLSLISIYLFLILFLLPTFFRETKNKPLVRAIFYLLALMVITWHVLVYSSAFSVIGNLRTFSMITTLSLLLLAIFFSPKRLLFTFGVFVTFVISSFVFDMGRQIVVMVENLS